MSENTLRVGIIGAGQAGERHAAGFGSVTQTTITAIADLDRTRAASLAAQYEAQVYTDWRAMLAEGLDIVVVSLPHNQHVAPAEAAARQGVHVMMEKPLATTMADARRIFEICAEHDVKLATSFVHRYREESQLLYNWVRQGWLGSPAIARETMNIERGSQVPGWITSREIGGGGVLMYSAIHGLDRLRWLLGSEVTQITARTHQFQPQTEVEDGVAALFTFANGATATLVSTAPAYPAQPTIWETEIIGDRGMGRLRTRQWAQLSTATMQLHETTPSVAATLGEHYNFMRQAEAFVQAIELDEEPQASGEDGLRALEIALGIYASAEQGRTVDPAEIRLS